MRILRKILVFLIGVLALSIAQGFTYPTTINVTGYTGIENNGSIPIFYNSTDFNFTLYNITVTGYQGFKFNPLPAMDWNNTANLSYSYFTDNPISQTVPLKIIFTYKSQAARPESTQYININNGIPYLPNITIYYNDTVVFANNDSVDYEMYMTDYSGAIIPSSNITIQAHSNFSRRYQQLGQFEYILNYQPFIYVNILQNNITIDTHTPGYDKDISFRLNFVHRIANFQTQVIPSTFSLKYDQHREGVLRIESTDTLYDVSLSGDWLKFEKNNFVLNQDDLIRFNVTPTGITQTSQTNMTYNKVISITTSNGGSAQVTIPVFIEGQQFGTPNASTIVVLQPMSFDEMVAYCDKINWTPPCATKNITNIEYTARVLYPQINETDAYNSIQSGMRAEEGVNRLVDRLAEVNNQVSALQNTINQQATQIELLKSNNSVKLETIAEDVTINRKNSRMFWSMSLFVIITVLVIGGTLFVVRFVKDRKPKLDMRI